MEIIELLNPSLVQLHMRSLEKWGAFRELAEILLANHRITSLKDFISALEAREKQVSTGVGEGIAIPHAISSSVLTPSIVFGRSDQGVSYDSIDGKPAYLFFMFAIPNTCDDKDYLRTLASMARLLVHPQVRFALTNASCFDEVKTALEIPTERR